MSRSKVSSQDVPTQLSDKKRSSSQPRREKPKPSSKLKGNEESESRYSTENKAVMRSKVSEPSSLSLRGSDSKATSLKGVEQGTVEMRRDGISSKSKQPTNKPSKTSQSIKDNKTITKSESSSNVGSRSRTKDHASSVNSSKPSPGMHKPKLKAAEANTSVKQNRVSQRHVKQEEKSTLPHKTSVMQSLSTRPGKEESRKQTQPSSKRIENGKGEGSRLNRERTKTRTLHPEDSQLLTTLQHAAQQLPQDIEPKPSAEHEEYEDDFEDYESDFEEAPSVEASSEEESDDDISTLGGEHKGNDEDDNDDKDNYDYGDSSSSASEIQFNKDTHSSINGKAGTIEEKKMDSGHYDLADERRLIGKSASIILDTRSNVEQINFPLRPVSSKSPTEEPNSRGNSYEVKFINFAQAKRRQLKRKASSKLRHRGEILLNMIRLDSVTLPLFDMAPVPYEIYMRSYGRSNTQQMSSQTNEDGISEEAQTDEINLKNRWTQHPPALFHPNNTMAHPMICAVSSDPCDAEDLMLCKQAANFDVIALEKFVLNAGQLMLNILEEMTGGTQGLLKSNKADLGFSQGFIILETDSIPFLKDRKVSKLIFIPHQPNSLLSVHLSSKEVSYTDDLPSQMVKRCVLCIWSLLQPSQPLKILVASSDVTACTFHPSRPHLLFAGLADGLLNVWDLREQSTCHTKVQFQDVEWSLKSPSYATVDQHGIKHSSSVVGVQVIDRFVDSPKKSLELSPTQICSLDENGLCLIWTVLSSSMGIANVEDAGVAPWGSIRLLLNESFSITQHVSTVMEDSLSLNLQFLDLAMDSQDATHLLAAANTGHVAHCLSSGSRAHPTVYLPGWDCLSPATCVCPCPFGLPYFLVGCGDGSIRLHTRLSARPLLNVAGSGGAVGSGPAIASIQWCSSRPCVFFALDSDSRLHVWDLGSSDMYPMLTVPFRGKIITTMQLSPARHSAKACPYLALGTSCGKLKVHLIKNDFASTSLEETAAELDKLKRYVTIL